MTVLIRLTIIPLSLYCLLLSWLYVNQQKLIFPGAMRYGTQAAQLTPPDREGSILQLATDSGTRLAAYIAPPTKAVKPTGKTILFFYGNGSSINGCWYIAERFRNLGCAVMLVDYPGFGSSAGTAGEIGCYQAADTAYRYLTEVRHINAHNIIIAGWSLGSSVAIHLASLQPSAGLITFSAFTTMATMASLQYPIVPEPIAALLLKYPFPSLTNIKRVHCPTFIVHGEDDSFVPPAMSRALAAADPAPVRLLMVPNVGHNDILMNGGPILYNTLRTWIDTLPTR